MTESTPHSKKRASRIHQRSRMIERARRVFRAMNTGDWVDATWQERWVLRHYNNLQACSCWMCGNPRRFRGELTIRERRVTADARTAGFEE